MKLEKTDKPAPLTKPIPKSAMTAFALLIAAQERDKQELARTICEEVGMPMNSAFDLQKGTITAPDAPEQAA